MVGFFQEWWGSKYMTFERIWSILECFRGSKYTTFEWIWSILECFILFGWLKPFYKFTQTHEFALFLHWKSAKTQSVLSCTMSCRGKVWNLLYLSPGEDKKFHTLPLQHGQNAPRKPCHAGCGGCGSLDRHHRVPPVWLEGRNENGTRSIRGGDSTVGRY